jgi:hypothetical protein
VCIVQYIWSMLLVLFVRLVNFRTWKPVERLKLYQDSDEVYIYNSSFIWLCELQII